MPDTRRLRPVLRVGQYTSQTREFRIVDPDGDPVNVTDADVTLTMEHDRLAYTAIDGGDVTIVDGVGGFVEYEFSAEDTALHGRYRVQFEVEYSDGETALYPPDDHTWVLDVGRRIPETQPLTVPSVSAEEGTYDSLQVGEIEIEQASISEVVGDPDISDLSIDSLDVDALAGGVVGTRGPLVRLDGPNLYIDEHGELASIDPAEDGYTEGADHDHSETGSGGDTLRPAAAVIASELGLPEYDDVENAPQTPGRIVYATGDGSSTEGIYKRDPDAYQRVLVDGDDFDGQDSSQFTSLDLVETSALASGAQTMYVRSDGDDSNSGLTASDAKATPQAAINDAALHLDGGQPLIINIQENDASFGPVDCKYVAASRAVRIIGATDADGNPATTLDGEGTDTTLIADSCRVRAENLILQNGAYANGYATKSGTLDAQNCEFRGGTNTPLNVAIDEASGGRIRDECVMNTDAGAGSSFSHATAVGSNLTIRGVQFSGTGVGQGVVGAKQSAFVHVDGGTLNADGDDCIRIVDGSDVKLGPAGITFENAANGINAARNSDVTDKANPGAHTFTDVTNPWKIQDASYAEDADGTEVWAAPINADEADVEASFGTGSWGAYHHLDGSDGYVKSRNSIDDEWHLGSLRPVATGEVALAAGGTQSVELSHSTLNGGLFVAHRPSTTENGLVDYIIRHTGSSDTVVVRFRETGGSNPATHEYVIFDVPFMS